MTTEPFTSDQILAARDAGHLTSTIEQALADLIGEPLAWIGRAADMIEIGLGAEVDAPTKRAPDRRLPAHVLHIQCPFRLDGPAGPLVGSRDVYLDPSRPEDTPADFDWASSGTSSFDVAVRAIRKDLPRAGLVCESVHADAAGGLQIRFAGGSTISAFPDSRLDQEHWRYFRPSDLDSHFVVFEPPDDVHSRGHHA